ncbi:MAG: GNAT family N-acetyltransferase [Prevotella sp.]|nr:GNAT family N-acetyltransferase [Prevotella sp.]
MKYPIKLRALELEDLDVLYQTENDVRLWDLGSTNVPYSRQILRDFILNSTGDIYIDKQVRLMIENGEGKVVGMADLIGFDPRHRRAEVGIVILEYYRHQGYGRASLIKLQEYAWQTLCLHQLYAYIDIRNEASLQLFSEVGFQRIATLRDWLYCKECYHDAVLMQRVMC